MFRTTLIAVLMLTAASTPALAAATDIARSAINGFILPGYERLEQQAVLTGKTIGGLCDAPGAAQLERARDSFEALVTAWSRIEIVRFGPILEENRLERILFWPDRRGVGLRQVQGILAQEDASATSLESLQEKSVAVQGLGGLEFALFGSGADALKSADGAFRCRYAETVVAAIAETVGEVATAWDAPDGIAARMMAPKPDYADYRTGDEVLQELLGVWVHGMELIRDTRLLPFLGTTPDRANAKAALFWRSGMTVEAMRANAGGLRDLFEISGMADALPEDMHWAAGGLLFEFGNFDRTARAIDMPLEQAVHDAQMRSRLNYLRILTGSIQNIAVRQIGATLGLTAGFSALDGD